MTTLRVVSLGCKLGNNLTQFLKRGHVYFEDVSRAFIDPKLCLGIDKQERFANDVTSQGYQFQALDVASDAALQQLPPADYYQAWGLLEHLPSKAWADALIQVMLHRARHGVWLRLTSFEPDMQTGEGVLRNMGLRFAWSERPEHPSPVLLVDAVASVNSYKKSSGRNSIAMKIYPGHRVRTTDDPFILPASAPATTREYRAELGPKPSKNLEPPLVSQWELIITL